MKTPPDVASKEGVSHRIIHHHRIITALSSFFETTLLDIKQLERMIGQRVKAYRTRAARPAMAMRPAAAVCLAAPAEEVEAEAAVPVWLVAPETVELPAVGATALELATGR